MRDQALRLSSDHGLTHGLVTAYRVFRSMMLLAIVSMIISVRMMWM